jgi:hypothetical protein
MNPIFVVMQFHIVVERAKPFLRSNIARSAPKLSFFFWNSLFCRPCETLAGKAGQFCIETILGAVSRRSISSRLSYVLFLLEIRQFAVRKNEGEENHFENNYS